MWGFARRAQSLPRPIKSRVGQAAAYRELRASRLNGPAPNCEISNAPPSIDRFFMNMII
jgi:hypothetical protein